MSDSSFELLFSGKVDKSIPVHQYRSKETGLRVVIAQVEGPLVNGYFCLATEAHDDDGLPHTLEHLVFMGSEQYPYKGVLDLLANRCLASGTNAWTDTDHTCYTMTTAGSDGFLSLMPIYLDHILYPTITDGGYITEVHHVTGSGEDAGVVYCEMQARENSGESLTHLAMLRDMYPGECGFKSETGGIMANLRDSTSHKKVCDYHRAFYQPENMCLIVTGQVDPQDVLNALKPFEQHIVEKGERPAYNQPWQSPVPGLPASVKRKVVYPSDDEEFGMVFVSWRGPLAKEQYSLCAVSMLFEYLTDTSAAPLQQQFVERADPYCSRVGFSVIENSESCIYTSFSDVPVPKLDEIEPKLMTLLSDLGNEKQKIDMKRMKNVIHRKILASLSGLENSPHDTVAFYVIGAFLYGDSKDEMNERINQVDSYRRLEKKPSTFWINLLKMYFLDKPFVTITGSPSQSLMENMGKEEENRVEKQKERLGSDGLQQKEKALETAISDNNTEPPDHLLTCVPVPDVGCIHYHKLRPSSNSSKRVADDNTDFPLAKMPIMFQLDDMPTQFVRMTILTDTGCVPANLRLYLPLLMESLLQSSILRGQELLSPEEVVSQLAADTISSASGLGVGGHRFSCGDYAQLATLHLQVEKEKYSCGVNWLKEILYDTVFSAERLAVIATKMVNQVATLKRSGRTVVQTVMRQLLYGDNSGCSHHNANMLRQHSFLTTVIKRLSDNSEAGKVVEEMTSLRDLLTRPSNMRVHMAASVSTVTSQCDPQTPWLSFIPPGVPLDGERPHPQPSAVFLASPADRALIVGVGSVESSFLLHACPAIRGHDHPDLPALMVYMQYLTQLEGPLWKQIRGLGLAYHYNMKLNLENGLLYFMLFKSTHLVKAYKQAQDILNGYLSGSTPMSSIELESCKSSLIFEIVEEESSPSQASTQSLLCYLDDVNHKHHRELIQKIPQVTSDDLQRVGEKYMKRVFSVDQGLMAVCCHPTKVTEITTGLNEFGWNFKVLESLDNNILSKI